MRRPPHIRRLILLGATAVTAAGLIASAFAQGPSPSRDNLDYWLQQATTEPAPASRSAATKPASQPKAVPNIRPDALPGVIQLSDGQLLAGEIYTTRGKDLEIWVEAEQRWRHVPLLVLRSIKAEIVSEGHEPEWRWREMGDNEKVYTGRSRPIRRLQWRLSLIDGTALTGEIKGQPLWIQHAGRRSRHTLHARSKGDWGQALEELTHVSFVVFSRREMDRVLTAASAGKAGR